MVGAATGGTGTETGTAARREGTRGATTVTADVIGEVVIVTCLMTDAGHVMMTAGAIGRMTGAVTATT